MLGWSILSQFMTFLYILWNCPDSVVCFVFNFITTIQCTVKWWSGQSSAANAKATQAMLRSSLVEIIASNFYCLHHNQVDRYEISIPHMTIDLYFLRRCFLSSITAKFLPDLTVFMSNTAGVLYEVGTTFLLRAHAFTPGFFVAHLASLLYCPIMYLYVPSPCYDVSYDFHLNTMFSSSLPSVVILCCIIVLLGFVLCILCCQFHSTVHLWLPLQYSLMFVLFTNNITC